MRMLVPDLIGLLQAGAQKHGAQKDFLAGGPRSATHAGTCVRALARACSRALLCLCVCSGVSRI